MRLLVYGDIGGSGGYVRYCKGLFGSGHVPGDIQTTFVCSPKLKELVGPLDPSVRIYTHPWMSSRVRLKRYLWHLILFPSLARAIQASVEFYPGGMLRTLRRQAKAVATCHNLLLFDDGELSRYRGTEQYEEFQCYRQAQVRSYERAWAVIFLSDHSRRIVTGQYPRVRASAVIPHGVDSCFGGSRARSYQLSDPVTLLYVSPVYYYKHQMEVVLGVKEARKRTGRDIRLRLVGGNNNRDMDDLQHLIESERADFVELAGPVPHQEVCEEMHKADMFVFASSCEAFPNTLIEAMATAIPIACSDRVGLPDVLKDGGVFFDPECPQSIADAVIELLEDSEKRQSFGERAREYSRSYTWERTAEETFCFLRASMRQAR